MRIEQRERQLFRFNGDTSREDAESKAVFLHHDENQR